MRAIYTVICALILAAAGMFGAFTVTEDTFSPNETVISETSAQRLRVCEKTEEIAHFFTHALVAYPEIGFDKSNSMRVNYDRDCLTVKEFKAILQSLYEKNYALVDIKTVYEVNGDTAVRRKFDFPEGKKPLVLSFDDINYYIKKMHRGMNDRLDADGAGRLYTYTEQVENHVNYDNEVVTVLENFIGDHPDFSYDGARGILCLTGFDGILGYRTQSGSPSRRRERMRAMKVVRVLKAKGWRFACHSYGHYHMKKLSDERFKTDTDKWLNEVGSLIGETDIYVYPYGEWEIKTESGGDCVKHAYLKEKGFRLFCGVGAKTYFSKIDGKTLFMDRKPLDGLSLRNLNEYYKDYFDSSKVYDCCRPTPFSH